MTRSLPSRDVRHHRLHALMNRVSNRGMRTWLVIVGFTLGCAGSYSEADYTPPSEEYCRRPLGQSGDVRLTEGFYLDSEVSSAVRCEPGDETFHFHQVYLRRASGRPLASLSVYNGGHGPVGETCSRSGGSDCEEYDAWELYQAAVDRLRAEGIPAVRSQSSRCDPSRGSDPEENVYSLAITTGHWQNVRCDSSRKLLSNGMSRAMLYSRFRPTRATCSNREIRRSRVGVRSSLSLGQYRAGVTL